MKREINCFDKPIEKKLRCPNSKPLAISLKTEKNPPLFYFPNQMLLRL
jgi:hypothetical protein